jgi:hypothetical protein
MEGKTNIKLSPKVQRVLARGFRARKTLESWHSSNSTATNEADTNTKYILCSENVFSKKNYVYSWLCFALHIFKHMGNVEMKISKATFVYQTTKTIFSPSQTYSVVSTRAHDKWTLIARFSNDDSKYWTDDGSFWYDKDTSYGDENNPSSNKDMISAAFWETKGHEISRSQEVMIPLTRNYYRPFQIVFKVCWLPDRKVDMQVKAHH